MEKEDREYAIKLMNQQKEAIKIQIAEIEQQNPIIQQWIAKGKEIEGLDKSIQDFLGEVPIWEKHKQLGVVGNGNGNHYKDRGKKVSTNGHATIYENPIKDILRIDGEFLVKDVIPILERYVDMTETTKKLLSSAYIRYLNAKGTIILSGKEGRSRKYKVKRFKPSDAGPRFHVISSYTEKEMKKIPERIKEQREAGLL